MARIPEAEIERLKNEISVERLIESAGITCNLKDFAPASQFGIHVLNPHQAFLQFKLAQPNSTKRISKP